MPTHSPLRRSHHQVPGGGDAWRYEFAAALHDSIIQRLLVVGVCLDPVADGAAALSTSGQVARSRSVLDEVIAELRSWISVLSTWEGEAECFDPVARVDLAASVADVIDEMILVLGFVPSFRCRADLMVPTELATDVTMVVREGLANIARHASATAAVVWVTESRGRLKVHLSDNGRWCDRRGGAGWGMSGMRRRAQRHGGSLAVSAGLFGTDVLWFAPLPQSFTDPGRQRSASVL